MSLRAVPRIEGLGMDVSQHGEEAYSNGEGSILVLPDAATPDPRAAAALTLNRCSLTPGGLDHETHRRDHPPGPAQ